MSQILGFVKSHRDLGVESRYIECIRIYPKHDIVTIFHHKNIV